MSSAAVIGVAIGIIILYVVLFGFAIANYILSSLGMYKLAKGRQISDPWMAWVPVVNDYLLGKVTEQYDESKGLRHKWSKLMLTLTIVNVGGMILFFAVYFVMLFGMIAKTAVEGNVQEEELIGSMVILFIAIFVVALIMSFAAIAYSVCKYVCIYKVFESAVPEKSIKYFLLSMIIPLAYGICLLKSAKTEMLQLTAVEATDTFAGEPEDVIGCSDDAAEDEKEFL